LVGDDRAASNVGHDRDDEAARRRLRAGANEHAHGDARVGTSEKRARLVVDETFGVEVGQTRFPLASSRVTALSGDVRVLGPATQEERRVRRLVRRAKPRRAVVVYFPGRAIGQAHRELESLRVERPPPGALK